MTLADKIRKVFSYNAPSIFEEPTHQDIGIIADAVGTLLAHKPVDFDTKGWNIIEREDYWHNDDTRREFEIHAPKERAAIEAIGEDGIVVEKRGLEQVIVLTIIE